MENSENLQAKQEKKPKKKGPIRTGAVVPFTVIVSSIIVFNIFFMDALIRSGMEIAATQLHGAEVNIDSFDSSFLNLSFTIGKIQVTNKENPEFNLFEIGDIKFKASWDAALRAKALIEEMSVNSVLIESKRKRPGRVLPPAPPESDSEQTKKKALAEIEKNFEGNALGEMAGLLGGKKNTSVKDSFLKDLESEKLLAETEKELSEQKTKLDQTLKSLPSDKEFSEYQSRFNQIKWNDLGNISKAKGVVDQVQGLQKDVKSSIAKVNSGKAEIDKSINMLNSSKKNIDAAIKRDMDAISKKMSLPKIDAENLAKNFFGKDVMDKIQQFRKYEGIIRKYMPPAKDPEAKPDYVKPKRQTGRDYRFGSPKSYPDLWIKKVAIDSKNKQGEMRGSVTHITSSQTITNLPTTAMLRGDFPGLELRDLRADLVLDHRGSEVKDTLEGSIASMTIRDKPLTKSPDATMSIVQAQMYSFLDAKFDGEEFKLLLRNRFKNSKLAYDSKSKELKRLLQRVAAKANQVTLDVKARGKMEKLDIKIDSNLAKLVENAARALIQEEIDTQKKKIEQALNQKVAGQKQKLESQIAALQNKYQGEVNKAQSQFKKFESDTKNKLASEQKKAKKSAEKGLLKNLKKKFKF